MKQSTEERARSRTSTPHRKDRPMRKLGKHLKVGDTIEVWWRPSRDTILAKNAHRSKTVKVLFEALYTLLHGTCDSPALAIY